MSASPADKFKHSSNGGIPAVATVQSPRTAGVTSLTVDTQQFWPTVSGIVFSTYQVDTNNVRKPGTQIDWEGVSNGTTTLSAMVRTGGATDTGNAVGDKVQMVITAQWAEDLMVGLDNQHNRADGTHSAITATTITTSGIITANGGLAVSAPLTLPSHSVTPAMVGLVKSAVDANGWIKRDYGNWQTYERTVTISALTIGASQVSIATHSMPVGIADSSLLRFSVEQLAGYQGRAFFGYDNNNTTAQTTLSLYGYNSTGSAITVSGLVYITAITV